MAKRDAKKRAHGDGPYREAPLTPPPEKKPWWLWALLASAALLALVFNLSGEDDPEAEPTLADVPPMLLDAVAVFPAGGEELPPATPLAPLLAADQPDILTLLSPRGGATRLQRGQALQVRFNRPMVEGQHVGGPAPGEDPLVFSPPVRGDYVWASRSRLSFVAEGRAWDRSLETTFTVAEHLRSLDGASVFDESEHVVVFDGTPHLARTGTQRVNEGAALPLYFDNPVSAAELAREVMAYELGGAARTVPVTAIARGEEESGLFRVDLRPRRALEAGAGIGVAVAPRWTRWGGASPSIVRFTVQPPPQIEGVGCGESASVYGRCDFGPTPGRVVDIGPALRVLASEALEAVERGQVRVRPTLPGMEVRFSDPRRRVVEVKGEWAPDQVYEVRFEGLRTADGRPLRRVSPLAVRSRGHAPEVRVAAGRHTWEREGEAVLAFGGIAVGKGALRYRPVAEGDELRAALFPTAYVADDPAAEAYTPLGPLVPDARPNRWGEGRVAWHAPEAGREATMAVLAFRSGAANPARPFAAPTVFAQRTDLGTTARATEEGVLVWVTSLSEAEPVAGAELQLADERGVVLAEAETDADGVAWIDTSEARMLEDGTRAPFDASAERYALLTRHGGDRSVLVVEPGRALGPARVGLAQGAPPPAEGTPRASVFADRGAYRPGETVRAKAHVRRLMPRGVGLYARGELEVRLLGPASPLPVATVTSSATRWGSVSAELPLGTGAALGRYTVQVVEPATAERDERVLGSTSLRVATFREPTFRVDFGDAPAELLAGEPLALDVHGTYLFGAPVAEGAVRWSLIREMAAPHPGRWSGLTFAPADGYVSHGTVQAGEGRLDDAGVLHIEPAPSGLEARRRERLVLEVEVRDRTGQSTAAHHRLRLRPAAYEVGLKRGADWVALGEPLELEAIVIDGEGEPTPGRAITGRVYREGWHSWHEWHGRSGSYQLRREQEREEVHECALESAETPVSCAYVPERPGTYLLEVTTVDEEGREAVASRRLYVAGPDEAPDRDPPGAPIAVTPSRARWAVGETAELAFESPFEEAEALIAVEQAGVLRTERRSVEAGGQVIRVPLTEAMVPNVFVSVALVRGRTGEPGEEHDLNAPDLRFGVAELRVAPDVGRFEVAVDAPAEASPGEEVEVAVRVTDEDGAGVRTEVALWMVDEGILRLTDYAVQDPTTGLYPRRPPRFGWEDLRRMLVSRVEPPAWRAGGDGSEGAERTLRPDEPIPEATPLWAPHLETDGEGRATARVTLPERSTEYRVIALAVGEDVAWGTASAQLVASRELVLADALPRFLTRGDEAEGAFFVHNTTDAEAEGVLVVTVDGAERVREELVVPARGQRRVPLRLAPDAARPMEVVARLEGGPSRRRVVPVAPKARWTRRLALGGIPGADPESDAPAELAVELRLPEAEAGRLTLTTGTHPFVGLGAVSEMIAASPWSDLRHRASAVLALAAQASLQGEVAAPGQATAAELRARGAAAVDRLLALQSVEGGFGRWSARSWAHVGEATLGVHALVAADAAGFGVPSSAKEKAVAWLAQQVREVYWNDGWEVRGLDAKAHALRVLAEAGEPLPEAAQALFDEREHLGIDGLAQLALALDEEPAQRDALVEEATRYALEEVSEDESLGAHVRHWERRARVLGPLLEATSASGRHFEKTGPVAEALLGLADESSSYAWASAEDAAFALRGLAAFAAVFAEADEGLPAVALDGRALEAAAASEDEARFALRPMELGGAPHGLAFTNVEERPAFFALEGIWTEPLGPGDRMARGQRVALHRRFEAADGRELRSGDAVRLGETVRVRLFVYTEGSAPPMVMLHDPMGGGFEAVQSHFATSAQSALQAMLGMGPDDEVVDPRGFHAMRSAGSISHRALERNAAVFYFDQLPSGLQEYTYVVRATAVGQFTLPPAQIEAARDGEFVGRSTVFELRVADGEARAE